MCDSLVPHCKLAIFIRLVCCIMRAVSAIILGVVSAVVLRVVLTVILSVVLAVILSVVLSVIRHNVPPDKQSVSRLQDIVSAKDLHLFTSFFCCNHRKKHTKPQCQTNKHNRGTGRN